MRTLAIGGVLGLLVGAAPLHAGEPVQPYREALDRALTDERAKVAETEIWTDHSTWENAWVATSTHYEVRTTQSFGLARDLAGGLDTLQGFFRSVLGSSHVPAQRAKVFVFPDIAAYNQFGQANNAAEHSSFYGSFHAVQAPDRPVAAVFDKNLTWLRIQITHSAAHQWLREAYTNTPPTWVDEGLASYFSLYWHPRWGAGELRKIIAEDRFLPLATLLAEPITGYSNRTDQRFIELGMLCSYLFHYREDTRTVEADGTVVRAPFRDYVVALLEGRDTAALPVHALFLDLPALQQQFTTFEFGDK